MRAKSLIITTLFTFLILNASVASASGSANYTIKKGDSLYLISQKFNIPIDKLKKANKLTSNAIYEGQALYIPPKNTTSNISLKYTVLKGESLFKISRKFNVSINSIKKINNLYSDEIYPGQALRIPSREDSPARGETTNRAQVLPWFGVVDKMFSNGTKVRVTDVDTGLTFWVARSFGHNHADIEPVTKEDTSIMKKAWGGNWSWQRRAVIVELNGKRLAASMNGMPHGQYLNYNNGMVGQVCMHFLNSRTHGSNKVDPAHQEAIKKAAAY